MDGQDEILKHIGDFYSKIGEIIDRYQNLPDHTKTHMQHAQNVLARVPAHVPISEPWRQFSADLLDCVGELCGDLGKHGQAQIEFGEAIVEAADALLESEWIRQ